MKTFIFLLVPFLKRAPCFIHCEGKAALGGRSTHVNHDPKLQRSRVYEILEEKFCAVHKKSETKKYNNNK